MLDFFQTSSRNLGDAEKKAGVGHHVALSVVGIDRLPASGYFRAKVAQEEAVKAASIPYTILRATQFFEFIGRIADSSADGDTVRLAPVMVQPEAADDVAAALADIATNPPLNDTVELAGPEPYRLDELARRVLSAKGDARQVKADVHARYFGAELDDHSLTPGDNPRIAPTRFEDWLSQSTAPGRRPERPKTTFAMTDYPMRALIAQRDGGTEPLRLREPIEQDYFEVPSRFMPTTRFPRGALPNSADPAPAPVAPTKETIPPAFSGPLGIRCSSLFSRSTPAAPTKIALVTPGLGSRQTICACFRSFSRSRSSVI